MEEMEPPRSDESGGEEKENHLNPLWAIMTSFFISFLFFSASYFGHHLLKCNYVVLGNPSKSVP